MKNITLHLLVNRQAGAGKGADYYKEVTRHLNKEHITYQTYFTEYAGHEKEIIASLLPFTLKEWDSSIKNFPLLVVIGGDGTLHEVVNALVDYPNIPVGYLPGGSGNDFARGIGMSRKIKHSLKQLLQATQPSPINLMKATEVHTKQSRLILNNVGLGLDAKIVATANQSKAKHILNNLKLGSLAYISAAFSSIVKQPSYPLTISTETSGKTFEDAYLCTTTNHPYFGGGVAIDPTASPFTEDIHLIVVEKIPPMQLLWLVMQLFVKNHLNSKHVHRFIGPNLSVHCQTPQEGQADGEVLGQHDFNLQFETTSRLFWI